MDSFNCIALLISLATTIGCGAKEHSPEETEAVQNEAPETFPFAADQFTVQALPDSQKEKKKRGIYGFHLSTQGVVAEERAYQWEPGTRGTSEVSIRQESDAFQKNLGPVAKGVFVSNLLVSGSGFQVVSLNPFLDDRGDLKVPFQLTEGTLVGNQLNLKKGVDSTFSMTPAGLGFVPDREPLREAYENSLLLASPIRSPMLFPSVQGAHLYVTTGIEASLYSLKDGSVSSIKRLDPTLSGLQVQACQSDSAPAFLFSGTAQNYHDAGISPPAHPESKDFKIFSVFHWENGNLRPFEYFVNEEGAFAPQVCAVKNRRIFLGGYSLGNDRQTERASLVAFGFGVNKRGQLPLPQNSVTTAITFGSQGEIFLGGVQGFQQAHSGSVTHMSGFVAQLNSDYQINWIRSLLGKRTTRVLSLATQDQGSKLLVGGSTNGPSTHDADTSSQSFIHQILLTQHKP